MPELLLHIEPRVKKAELIVIGGSAGSFAVIHQMVRNMPGKFPVPVIVLIHRGKQYSSVLEELLQLHADVVVKEAEDKEPLSPGVVYIAPADYHVLIERNHTISLDSSEPVWFCRPSIDVLFESAADIFGDRLVAMLFSGANPDGTDGMAAIHGRGGVTFAQDPRDAEFPTMPGSAIKENTIDHIFYAKDIGLIINEICRIKKNVHL